MLRVGVDERDVGRGAREKAGEAGADRAPLAGVSGGGATLRLRRLRRASRRVRRAVVHDEDARQVSQEARDDASDGLRGLVSGARARRVEKGISHGGAS